MKYTELTDYINTLILPYRGDCPVCFNKNTFIANIQTGQISYYCFHASCKLRGKSKYNVTLENIRTSSVFNNARMDVQNRCFSIPSHFTGPLQNNSCFNFLRWWHILDLYTKGSISLYYDPRLNRCVFILKDPKDGTIRGATGRSLIYANGPRWFIYDRSQGCPFIVRRSPLSKRNQVLLVEDCISACTANYICDSMALLGTNISMGTMEYLKGYLICYIALDPDALSKAIKLQHQLSPYIETKILNLDKDLKYFNEYELDLLKKTL